jgi:hypothetical protein
MTEDRWTMDDLSDELRARRDSLLAKLATLSDAPTQRMDLTAQAIRRPPSLEPGETMRGTGTARRPHLDSREPPGVRERRSVTPSPEHDPLFDWFADRLAKARSEAEVLKICTIAEAKWELATGRSKAPLAVAANPETTKTRDARIARDPDYLGLAPEIVAAAETHVSGYVSAENVRRVRLADGREPETAHPLPVEREMRGPARKKRAKELYDAGMPVVEIAFRFGVSRQTVHGWVGKKPDENGEQAA